MKRHPDLLNLRECAVYLGMDRCTLYVRMADPGHPLPTFKIGHSRWFWKPDVERWLEEEAHGTATAAPTPMRRAG